MKSLKRWRSAEYIVVFKKSATPDQVNKYADEVNANGLYHPGEIYDAESVARDLHGREFLQARQ